MTGRAIEGATRLCRFAKKGTELWRCDEQIYRFEQIAWRIKRRTPNPHRPWQCEPDTIHRTAFVPSAGRPDVRTRSSTHALIPGHANTKSSRRLDHLRARIPSQHNQAVALRVAPFCPPWRRIHHQKK